jgi:hypothetical protein
MSLHIRLVIPDAKSPINLPTFALRYKKYKIKRSDNKTMEQKNKE